MVASHDTSVPSTNKTDNHGVCNWYIVNIGVTRTKMYKIHYFSLSIFYLPTRRNLNKLMKRSPIYNKLYTLFNRACMCINIFYINMCKLKN